MNSKRQYAKVGVAGSFINQLMSNNSSLPVVGKGATQMLYTDRICFEVVEVSKDGKTVKLERLNAVADPTKNNTMGHQNWIFEPTGQYIMVQWRHNAWRQKSESIMFTEQYAKTIGRDFYQSEDYKRVYDDETGNMRIVEGITENRVEWSKINIIFGVKDYHYDWSF